MDPIPRAGTLNMAGIFLPLLTLFNFYNRIKVNLIDSAVMKTQ